MLVLAYLTHRPISFAPRFAVVSTPGSCQSLSWMICCLFQHHCWLYHGCFLHSLHLRYKMGSASLSGQASSFPRKDAKVSWTWVVINNICVFCRCAIYGLTFQGAAMAWYTSHQFWCCISEPVIKCGFQRLAAVVITVRSEYGWIILEGQFLDNCHMGIGYHHQKGIEYEC